MLVQDEGSKLGKWPLGRITNVMPGRNGVVQTLEAKTKTGTYIRRYKIFKLEDTQEKVGDME